MRDDIARFRKEAGEVLKSYVTVERFSPVERVVYGLAGVILIGTVIAWLRLLGLPR